MDQPIFNQCSIFIPPENISKPQFSNVFRGKEGLVEKSFEISTEKDILNQENNFEMDVVLLFPSVIQITEFSFQHNLN